MLKRVLKILKIASLISIVIILVQSILDWGKEIIWQERLEDAIVVFVVALFLTIINIYYEEYISERYSWESQPKKRLVIGSLGSIAATVLSYGFLRMIIFAFYYGQSLDFFFNNERKTEYIFFTIIAFIISLVIHAFYFYKASQESKVKEQKIIAGTA